MSAKDVEKEKPISAGGQSGSSSINSNLASENKTSNDILNELFQTFNSSFDEESINVKKKKKKSKKSKSSKKKKETGSDGGDSKKLKKKSSSKKSKKADIPSPVPPVVEVVKEEKKSSKHKKDSKKNIFTTTKVLGIEENPPTSHKSYKIKISLSETKEKKKSRKKKSSVSSLEKPTVIEIKPDDVDIEEGEILEDDEKSAESDINNKTSKKRKRRDSSSRVGSQVNHERRRIKLDDEEELLLLGYKPNEDNLYSGSSSSRESSNKKKSEHRSSKLSRQHSNSDIDDSSSIRRAPSRDDTPAPSISSSYSSSAYLRSWYKEKEKYSTSSSSNNDNRRNRYEDRVYNEEDRRYALGRNGFGFADRTYYDNSNDEEERDRDYSSRSRSNRKLRRSRSRSRSRSRTRNPEDVIDKVKLLEIARRNATKLMRNGVLPTDIFSRDQIVAIKAGGKSVEELTDYCRRLATKDARGDADDFQLSGDDSEVGGSDEHFIHHPFVVKERPMPQITLNIRNAIPLPVRTPQELAIANATLKNQFPVSSGTQHRFKELEWKPVSKEEEQKNAKTDDADKSLVPLNGPKMGNILPILQSAAENPAKSPSPVVSSVPKSVPLPSGGLLAITNTSSAAKPKKVENTGISINLDDAANVDISAVISMRLRAMRKLQENPEHGEAKKQLGEASKMMKDWAQAKALEPKFLSQSELCGGPQAWAKKDQLKSAKEVAGGMGMHLLKKMGWSPGEGLGKNKEGSIQPLALDVKTDKKGLTAAEDSKKVGPTMPSIFDLSAKHPVSALMELCVKRKWGPPAFDLCFEHGPAHQKQFVFKVTVNGVEYQPCVATNNKKLAKANAAAFCLQSLGLIPTPKPTATENLQSVPTGGGLLPTPSNAIAQGHFLQTVPSNP